MQYNQWANYAEESFALVVGASTSRPACRRLSETMTTITFDDGVAVPWANTPSATQQGVMEYNQWANYAVDIAHALLRLARLARDLHQENGSKSKTAEEYFSEYLTKLMGADISWR
ncbi:hypothetical protein EJ03DRAFT_350047 [Teratosphaeria nubilosa]|uniref:Uncharacterized protein n=1 Tax=Teratosphaeria nubilosa TaxID=161662 RepID=A0A6G1LDQ0_9PEZI|nr:hypothetical protein EJ03DRAFT_350047 [Teratosphaeria nubilosa]